MKVCGKEEEDGLILWQGFEVFKFILGWMLMFLFTFIAMEYKRL